MQYLSIVPRFGGDLMFVAVEDVADVAKDVLFTQLVISHVHVILWTYQTTTNQLLQKTDPSMFLFIDCLLYTSDAADE